MINFSEFKTITEKKLLTIRHHFDRKQSFSTGIFVWNIAILLVYWLPMKDEEEFYPNFEVLIEVYLLLLEKMNILSINK